MPRLPFTPSPFSTAHRPGCGQLIGSLTPTIHRTVRSGTPRFGRRDAYARMAHIQCEWIVKMDALRLRAPDWERLKQVGGVGRRLAYPWIAHVLCTQIVKRMPPPEFAALP